MVIKYSISEFMEFCKKNGLDIDITRNYVYINNYPIDPDILPNCRTDIFNKEIRLSWKYSSYGVVRNLKDAIKNNEKVASILILKGITNLGLKNAKDLYENNIDDWKKIVKEET